MKELRSCDTRTVINPENIDQKVISHVYAVRVPQLGSVSPPTNIDLRSAPIVYVHHSVHFVISAPSPSRAGPTQRMQIIDLIIYFILFYMFYVLHVIVSRYKDKETHSFLLLHTLTDLH